MKIAFFSDIHANLPALEAFFRDIEEVQPDALYCLGDLVGYNVWANEVVEEIRKRNIVTIMGNHDEALLFPPGNNDKPNRRITREIVSTENREYLISLPRQLRLSFGTGDETFNLLLVHGSPQAINDYLVEDYPEDDILNQMKSQLAHVVLCGHTHIPYHRVLQARKENKHVINIGAVGKPKDGDPRVCYAIMTFDEHISRHNQNTLEVEFRRVDYDMERAVQAIKESDFPNEFADNLIQAK
ncbi:MAG: metallophosphoesterase family protein [Cyclobacteriaceae bacterium]